LTEDGLFDLIRKSKPAKASVDKHQSNNNSEKLQKSQTKSSPAKVGKRGRSDLSLMLKFSAGRLVKFSTSFLVKVSKWHEAMNIII
jgi:hypothetical protein